MGPKKDSQNTADIAIATKNKEHKGFSNEEKAAMKERARELKASTAEADGETAVLEAIARMVESDRAMVSKLHEIIKASAPTLLPKLWYGMPAYARDGKVVCFFQPAKKFKTRSATLGFNDQAHLDEGDLWPVAFAVKGLNAAEEARIRTLVKKAAG